MLCTPENGEHGISPEILFAAYLCGVDKIFRVGGAQAIAAMAFGTESIPKVDKIFGPGNRFVTKAKQMVSRFTAIDMPAGPSEVMVLADDTASPTYVAADMLSQAEHGPDSQAIAVCSSESIAESVRAEVERLASRLPRRDSIEGSLSHSRIITFADRESMIDFANTYASEHLIISMRIRGMWLNASLLRVASLSVIIRRRVPGIMRAGHKPHASHVWMGAFVQRSEYR